MDEIAMNEIAMNHGNLQVGDLFFIVIMDPAASVGCGGKDGRYPVGVFTGESV